MGTLGLQVGAAFCFLNFVCALFISFCFRHRLASFQIVALLNGWDADVKATSCWRAALYYLSIGVVLYVMSWWKQEIHRDSVEGHDGEARCSSVQPLLSPTQRVVGYDAGEQFRHSREPRYTHN